ncbi:hypothetical protein LTS18_002927 [Coniosporium uncinatum]|uniref:Uncharacterized protein n=1 Tax=Coniosporium uncinatum TaxID=93489 RepID=A0ACC3DZX1_9PEZI|nr:hypothetical protein LTS18_002927 [Coniosporium uncinatum]
MDWPVAALAIRAQNPVAAPNASGRITHAVRDDSDWQHQIQDGENEAHGHGPLTVAPTSKTSGDDSPHPDRKSFYDLPPEIRLEIYKLVAHTLLDQVGDRVPTQAWSGGGDTWRRAVRRQHRWALGLSSVSSVLRSEFLEEYYPLFQYCLQEGDDDDSISLGGCRTFVRGIGEANVRLLRKMALAVGYCGEDCDEQIIGAVESMSLVEGCEVEVRVQHNYYAKTERWRQCVRQSDGAWRCRHGQYSNFVVGKDGIRKVSDEEEGRKESQESLQ